MLDLTIVLRRLKAFVALERLKYKSKVNIRTYSLYEIVSLFILIDDPYVTYKEITEMSKFVDKYPVVDIDPEFVREKIAMFVKYSDDKIYNINILLSFFFDDCYLTFAEILLIIDEMSLSPECNMKEKVSSTLMRTHGFLNLNK